MNRSGIWVVIAFLLCLWRPAGATEQMPYTFLVKSSGNWQVWADYVDGGAIVITNEDARTKAVIYITELIHNEELQRCDTTAGPIWGEYCLWYIAELDGRSVFRARTKYKSDLLIDLDAAKSLPGGKFRDKLEDLDRKTIVSILENAKRTLDSTNLTLRSVDAVHAAILHASSYVMTNCLPFIRVIQSDDYVGAGVLPSSSDPYTQQGAIDHVKGYWHYTFYETRRLASLALRQLGEAPVGFSAIGFLPQDKTNAHSAAFRRTGTSRLALGQTPKMVYEILGPPDYIEHVGKEKGSGLRWNGAWRYDVDGSSPHSLVISWDVDGCLKAINRVTPPLWHGDSLISDESVKPVFNPDGSIHRGVELGGKAFRGRIETIIPKKSDR
ncbi:MAG TPA: hypothetical protein VFZ59_10320 [Verrucomicrobiae bacterium]|nr:hypothetical protein [Verrucomicrobiae bacterium]